MSGKKRPFSKVIVGYVLFLVTAFIVFCCYEMHRLENLDPVQVMGTGIVSALTLVVGAYMWRAKQADLATIELEKIKEKAELRSKYGEFFEDETLTQVEDDSYM